MKQLLQMDFIQDKMFIGMWNKEGILLKNSPAKMKYLEGQVGIQVGSFCKHDAYGS